MPALNGYTLTNHFRKLRQRVAPIITPLQAYLFFELVAICNDAEWPAEFSATNGAITGALGCSEEGLIRARLRLQEVGLIDFISGTRRTPTLYRFLLNGSGELSDAPARGSGELSKKASQGSANGSDELSKEPNYSANGSANGSGELSPYKEQTKTKSKSAQSRKNDETEIAVTFDAFWDAYGKKRDRFKSEKKWATLTPKEQAAALAHAPLYAAATADNPQYRKDPLTYLNGRCWLDEHLPTPRNGAPAAPVAEPLALVAAPEINEQFLAEQTARAAAEEAAHFARFGVAA
jgi:hypothetical protein